MPSFTDIYPTSGAAGAGGSSGAGAAASGGNDAYPGMPAGAVPLHKSARTAVHGSLTIFTPPAGKRMVVASAFITADGATRAAIVDGSDTDGHRIVEQYVGANGGSSPNLLPVPFPQDQAATPLLLVTGSDANVAVRVSGWLVDA